ncbi:MAG: urease accessory protein UreF [Rhodobacteraceae bacterium]|nr:urease accessory protein UreF [Paracoccaceae bacterium]
MRTDLLTLTQWMSPAFPLGSFAYSHGLETAISEGKVSNARGLQDWLHVILTRGSGWTDALLLCAARDGENPVALARALAGSKERLEETEAQGAAFAATLRAMGHDIEDAPLPVALGVASRSLELESDLIAGVYLQSFTSNLVSCSVRFVPLGQKEGQNVLAALAPAIQATAERAATASFDDLGSGAFFSDISSMKHESQTARVFRT